MKRVEVKAFGRTKGGEEAKLFTLENENGMRVVLSDFGATVKDIVVKDKNNNPVDVCLGYDDIDGYYSNNPYFGSFVGRNANRIAKAETVIGGKTYKLDKNDGNNNCHSGFDASNIKMYEADVTELDLSSTVKFSRCFPDMEQGLPGNTDMTVSYTLTEDNELIIEYFAVSDKDTLMNPTNHSYFNLNGHKSGDILSHVLKVNSDAFTPTDNELIPTGEIRKVTGTPMDFREPKKIGLDIDADYEPLNQAGGYDHNYVLDIPEGELIDVASLTSEDTGITLEVLTDRPGIQIYTGNFLDGKQGKDGAVYKKRGGVCLETQNFPNACNEPLFKGGILKAGEEFKSITVFKFI